MTRTLPEHDRCDNHRKYRLSCDQLEELVERSGQRCEICRTPSGRTSWRRLHIDHCGPRWAVRGLLCGNCNICLEDDKAGSPEAKAYLANAWWEQRCATLGLPITLRPEPAVGSAIRTQYGEIWIRRDERFWEAPTQNGRHSPASTWDGLYRSFGPHNLAPFDLAAAVKDDSLQFSIQYALKNGECWSPTRSALGMPEPERKCYVPPRGRDTLPWLKTPEQTVAALRRLLTAEECLRIGTLLLAPPTESWDD